MNQIPECFYRVSVKALILDENRSKFLVIRDVSDNTDGMWELPGGGLDWDMSPQEDLRREIKEEMGLEVSWMAEYPSYFFTCRDQNDTHWKANIIYETKLADLDFTPTDECQEIRFVSIEEARELPLYTTVEEFLNHFDPKRHTLA